MSTISLRHPLLPDPGLVCLHRASWHFAAASLARHFLRKHHMFTLPMQCMRHAMHAPTCTKCTQDGIVLYCRLGTCFARFLLALHRPCSTAMLTHVAELAQLLREAEHR